MRTVRHLVFVFIFFGGERHEKNKRRVPARLKTNRCEWTTHPCPGCKAPSSPGADPREGSDSCTRTVPPSADSPRRVLLSQIKEKEK